VAPYTASIRGMSKAAAMEFGDWNIRVNSIHLGFIKAPLTEGASNMVEAFNDVVALERTGELIGITQVAIIMPASDESTYITGASSVVKGQGVDLNQF